MGNAGPTVRTWDIATGKERTSLGGHTLQAHSVSISRDGKTVVTYGGAPYLLVWDWPAAKLRRKIELRTTKSSRVLAVSPDGKQAEIMISGENAIRSFDLDSGRELPSIAEAHRAAVYAVEITPDGKLISTGYDNTIRVWDLSRGRQLREIRTDHPVGGQTMALSLDGKLVATGEHMNRGTVCLHDPDSGRLVKTIDPGGTSVGWVAFTSEDGLLAIHSVTEAKELFLAFWDIEQGREVRRLPLQALRYVLSPDGRLLAGYRPDWEQISLVDVATGRERQALRQKDVWAVAFSPDGRTLACGDSNRVTLWEIRSG
jgi:WD40 repeat protein